MLLAIDMGNTNIVLGVFDGDDIRFTARIATDLEKTEVEYAVVLKDVMEMHGISPGSITGSIISSVVPPLTHIVKQGVRRLVNDSEPMVVGAGLETGLNIKIDDPRTLGADLVVDSVAAMTEYGAPNIVVDMGTATTITVIDKDRNYIGGVIVPGVVTSLEALVSGTSQLPRVSLSSPDKFICTNTVDCMKSGIINGQAALVDGIIDRFEDELGYKTKVIATGGLSKVIIPKCRHEIVLDSALMMKGLKAIYDKNNA